jgi:membrane-associated phospholipid phosphatase
MAKTKAIEKADKNAAEAVAPARSSLAVKGLGWLSELADQPQLISICAGTLLVGLVTRNPRLARAGSKMLAAELLATKLKTAVKHRVDRTRPHVVEDGGDYEMHRGSSRASSMSSFPSGHTAGAVTVARAFAREYPEHRGGAYAAAIAVAAIQVPRCQHYPSDLAAGALIGFVAEEAVHLVDVMLREHVLEKLRPVE